MGRGVGARVWLALWTVYLVWGSTYLAIRVLVHPSVGTGMPPLIGASARFIVAGVITLAATVRRPAADGQPDPLGWRQWGSCAVVGVALLLGGNGLVSIAERRVASGPTAVIIATVPIWAALLVAVTGRERVRARHAVGLALGFAGVAALVAGSGGGRLDPLGVTLLLVASLSWSAGSVWSRTAPLPRRPLVMTGMEMICGGVGCLVVGLATGEAGRTHLSAIPARSWWALAYLVVFGSMAAYTAYVWLLGNAPLPLVTTYAYVNPLVAVLLGAVLLGEPFTVRTAIATVVIVAGVALIVSHPRRRALDAASPSPPALAEAPVDPAAAEAAELRR
ncbi:MAG TPA: EamA family transporter [Mycobacteriales bacterium]|nr:EamA family transporter [Mycobacteriales bacterium]